MTNCPVNIWRNPMGLLLYWTAFCFALVPVRALDPAQPPGRNFDLRHWKLTLPDPNASEISPELLIAGVTNTSFFTGEDGAMVFSCPVSGGTTSSSAYPRCELRELVDPANENVNWTAYGTHVIDAQCRVTQIPSSKKTIIGQIHSYTGNARPLIKLQFNNGKVEALVKQSPNSDSDTVLSFAPAGLGDLIDYQIKLADGLLSLTVNGTNKSVNVFESDAAWRYQAFYFKAGNYCQDNAGPTNEGAMVWFYELNVAHSAIFNTPPILSNHGVNANGNFGFSLLSQGDGNFTIETSTDLATWSDLLTTNTVAGQFDFADTSTPVTSFRFYRARRLP
jgi:hypothetical protein